MMQLSISKFIQGHWKYKCQLSDEIWLYLKYLIERIFFEGYFSLFLVWIHSNKNCWCCYLTLECFVIAHLLARLADRIWSFLFIGFCIEWCNRIGNYPYIYLESSFRFLLGTLLLNEYSGNKKPFYFLDRNSLHTFKLRP